ncbi:MAG: hypothetical protein JWP02_1511, partial [Acidimicrobiales bacterium]|nr:hypothetical protein [Acidimicrobiales bacterium]
MPVFGGVTTRDPTAVHKGGNEAIGGTKSFAVPPV